MTECLTDMERMLVVTLVTRAYVDLKSYNNDMETAIDECLSIIQKLSGTGKRVLIVTARQDDC